MKTFLILFVSILFTIGIYAVQLNQKKSVSQQSTKNTIPRKINNPRNEEETITIVAVGDIMMGTNYPAESYLPPSNTKLLSPMIEYFKKGDVVFGNLEGTVLNSGGEVKSCTNPATCYAFRQPEYLLDQLKEAGFNMLSIANNHVGDFGTTGRKNTMRVLSEKGFCFAGQTSCPTGIITIKGVKIGFTAFAPNNGCLSINDYNLLTNTVRSLNNICDIVIVSFHGGAEGPSATHVPKQTELFLGENRGNVTEFARKAIDAGADVILGHGPHVSRAIDHYKGRFITYSMGNFCTYGRFNLKGYAGIAPLFELKVRRDGSFVSGKIVSIKQIGEGGPILDKSAAALNEIKQLTITDFPQSNAYFDGDGNFFFNTK